MFIRASSFWIHSSLILCHFLMWEPCWSLLNNQWSYRMKIVHIQAIWNEHKKYIHYARDYLKITVIRAKQTQSWDTPLKTHALSCCRKSTHRDVIHHDNVSHCVKSMSENWWQYSQNVLPFTTTFPHSNTELLIHTSAPLRKRQWRLPITNWECYFVTECWKKV
jgi:hypothetical protein